MEGIIIRGYGGFYIVETENNTYTCSLRGKLKKDKNTRALVGDRVRILPLGTKDRKTEMDEAVVEEILERENELIRPRIANVTQAILVLPLADPEPDFVLLDRLLILIQNAGVTPIICFNKCDLVENEPYTEMYRNAGFKVIRLSTKTKAGIDEVKEVLHNHISVLAGPSGAGKSSLTNLIDENLNLQVGDISEKLGRGKHTTKYVELWSLGDNSYIADTPGFSRLDLPENLNTKNLSSLYPEFREYSLECGYNSCLHNKEDLCGVKEALANGKISQERYDRYIQFLMELEEREERKYD